MNFPGIDRSVSEKTIAEGKRFVSRYYRNRRLGEFLKELDLSEGHSSGIPTIQEELTRNGSPRAEFFTDQDRRAMRVRIPVHPSFLNNETSFETSFETSLKQILSEKNYEKIHPLIKLLDQGKELSIQDVISVTGKSRATAWRYMQLLNETGLIENTGNTNNVLYRKNCNRPTA